MLKAIFHQKKPLPPDRILHHPPAMGAHRIYLPARLLSLLPSFSWGRRAGVQKLHAEEILPMLKPQARGSACGEGSLREPGEGGQERLAVAFYLRLLICLWVYDAIRDQRCSWLKTTEEC